MRTGDDYNKYSEFYEKSLAFILNWIIPALVFIALITIAFHSYFSAIGV